MKHAFGLLLLLSFLTLTACGGDESAADGTPAAAPGTEIPTQTTTVVVELPAGGGTDTAAAPATATGTATDTATAAPAPAASPAQ